MSAGDVLKHSRSVGGVGMDDVQESLEQEQSLRSAQAGTERHAVEVSRPEALLGHGVGGRSQVDQALTTSPPSCRSRSHRVDERAHELRRQLRRRRKLDEGGIEPESED